MLSFGCTQLIACCANTELTGCPKCQIKASKNQLMSFGWSKKEKLVYHNVNVNGCQAKNYLCVVYVWFIIVCQMVLEFISVHKHNIFVLFCNDFSYQCMMYNLLWNTLWYNHGRVENEDRKYSLSKTNPMEECHGLEFRLPLMSYYTQEGFSKGALKLKLDTYL